MTNYVTHGGCKGGCGCKGGGLCHGMGHDGLSGFDLAGAFQDPKFLMGAAGIAFLLFVWPKLANKRRR